MCWCREMGVVEVSVPTVRFVCRVGWMHGGWDLYELVVVQMDVVGCIDVFLFWMIFG